MNPRKDPKDPIESRESEMEYLVAKWGPNVYPGIEQEISKLSDTLFPHFYVIQHEYKKFMDVYERSKAELKIFQRLQDNTAKNVASMLWSSFFIGLECAYAKRELSEVADILRNTEFYVFSVSEPALVDLGTMLFQLRQAQAISEDKYLQIWKTTSDSFSACAYKAVQLGFEYE